MHTRKKKDIKLLSQIFSEISGEKEADKIIIQSKLLSIRMNLCKLYNLLKLTAKKVSDFRRCMDMIVESLPLYSIESGKENYDYINSLSQKQCNLEYQTFLKSKLFNIIELTHVNLKNDKFFLENINENLNYIFKIPGIYYNPLQFFNKDFNLKVLWLKKTDSDKKFLLYSIKNIYEVCTDILEITKKPNISINKFSEIIKFQITKMKRQIRGCDGAFGVLLNSLGMLEDNFDSYYRDAVDSHNPSIILENFISDISKNQRNASGLTSEFRKIILYVKKQSNGTHNQGNNRVKFLLDFLDKNFRTLEKQELTSENLSDEEIQKIKEYNEEFKDNKLSNLNSITTDDISKLYEIDMNPKDKVESKTAR